MKILSLGSLNLDYTYAVEHFVSAGETISSISRSTHRGGKGLNQSVALAKAGAEVYHAGRIGTDGTMLTDWLKQCGADISLTETDPDIPTGHAIIQVEPNGQNCIIICAGTNGSITPEFVDNALRDFSAGDIILMQNETSSRDYAIRAAKAKGLRVALNPSPITAELVASDALSCVDWFILNEIEGKALTGETEPDDICKALKAKYPDCTVMLTLGSDGCVFYDGSKRCSHGIYKVKAVDTTAAGDTFTGYFLAVTAKGGSPEEAIAVASKASAIAVSRPGASDSIPSLDEVMKADLGEPESGK